MCENACSFQCGDYIYKYMSNVFILAEVISMLHRCLRDIQANRHAAATDTGSTHRYSADHQLNRLRS